MFIDTLAPLIPPQVCLCGVTFPVLCVIVHYFENQPKIFPYIYNNIAI